MKDQKQGKSENQRSQASKGGQQPSTQGGRSGGEASSGARQSSSGGQQPSKPQASDGGGSRVGAGSSQGLSGAQGSGGGADRGMQQSPKSRPDSLDRND